MEELVLFERDSRDIVIKFDEIFDQDISQLNRISIAKKRAYVNIGDAIKNEMNEVFNNTAIAWDYLSILYKLKAQRETYSEDEFINDIQEMVKKEDVRNFISESVEKVYTVSLDQNTKKTKVVNEELQFTDTHAMIVLKVSKTQKIIIPLICTYIEKYNNKNGETFCMKAFSKLFEVFTDDDNVDILVKLFKLIDSRVLATRFSDQIIWAYLKNMAVDTSVITRELYKKVITSIIPKLEDNRNIVSYLHVVLKNSIRFKFTYDYPISYKPMNLNKVDSEGLSEFDRLEINLIRVDESLTILNKLTIKSEINRFIDRYQLDITDEEFMYYRDNIVRNTIQTNLLFLFFSKYVGSYFNLYNCSFEEYVMLLIIARKWLEKHGFNSLSKFITGVPETGVKRKTINKRDFLVKLTSSKKYEELYKEKYKFVISNMVDSGIIIDTIATLNSNKFYHLPDFHSGETEMEEITEKIENISEEFLGFIELI